MIQSEVISLVNKPIDWCSGVFVVPIIIRWPPYLCWSDTPEQSCSLWSIPLAYVDENLAKIKVSQFFTGSMLTLDSGRFPSIQSHGLWPPSLHYSEGSASIVSPFEWVPLQKIFSNICHEFEKILKWLYATWMISWSMLLLWKSTTNEFMQYFKNSDAGATLNQKCEFARKCIILLGHSLSRWNWGRS